MSDAQQASSGLHLNWETTAEVAAQRASRPALRVLVVEDEWILGISFAETIEDLGHSVCAIATTQEGAVAAAALHDPDLMIVDGALGAGSGLLAVEHILRTKVIPHVFVTGDRAGILAVRPDAVVIEKPFRVRDLAAAIRRAMAETADSPA
jgi:two-component system, response regulator PdtaR